MSKQQEKKRKEERIKERKIMSNYYLDFLSRKRFQVTRDQELWVPQEAPGLHYGHLY